MPWKNDTMPSPNSAAGAIPRVSAVDRRVLPVYAAGAIDVPFVIAHYQENVQMDTRWEEHSHPTHELLWNESGVSQVTVKSRTWVITPAVGLWLPAGMLHSGTAVAGTRCNFSHFGINAVRSISAVPVAVELTALLRLLLERLADSTLGSTSRRIAEDAVLDLLTPTPHEVFLHLPQSRLLAPIVAAVQQNPGLQRSGTDWARELGVSARTITRAFQAETGGGFAQWVAKVRAQRAITLLARGDDLEDVVKVVGYGSSSAFGAAFKRTTGFTPSTFRGK